MSDNDLKLVVFVVVLIALAMAVNRLLQMLPRKPQTCMCGHGNHVHREHGRGECLRAFGQSEAFPRGSSFACTMFVPKPPESDSPKDQVARDLEKMVGL